MSEPEHESAAGAVCRENAHRRPAATDGPSPQATTRRPGRSMSQTAPPLDMTAGFRLPSEQQWRELVDKALKGADFDERLVSRTADGIALNPLYMQAGTERLVTGAAPARPWTICQRLDHPDPSIANTLALGDLEGGANELAIVTPDAGAAAGYGHVFNTVDDLARTLSGIALDMISLRLEPAASGKRNAALLAATLIRSGIEPAKLTVNFGFAPLAALVHGGSLAVAWSDVAADLAASVSALRKRGFEGPQLTCDIRPVHQAGGSEAQELAVALATGVAYLRALTDNGMSPDAAARALSWTVAVDADQFLGIAKLRALRLLWARVEEASRIAPQSIAIHAETAWRMMSRRDPAVNMLRTTMATAAASIAGADSISVLPFTLPLGLPNAFARRIARNTQIILAEESNLWRVADPAAGAGAFEALTDALCEKAWAGFQQIESEGGIVESLRAGHLQARIAATRATRATDVARRKIALTGTSEFPNLAESAETVLDVPHPPTRIPPKDRKGDQAASFAALIERFTDGASLADVTPPPSSGVTVEPLPSRRLSEPFEALRDKADAYLDANGKRPRVFLANLGPLAEHGTRATWARNLLAAGGIEASTNDGFANSADVGQAFADSGATVACICGTDETYAELAEATAQLLKQAGARKVYLAGRPSALEQALTAAGIDGYLAVGIDVLAALNELHEALDVS